MINLRLFKTSLRKLKQPFKYQITLLKTVYSALGTIGNYLRSSYLLNLKPNKNQLRVLIPKQAHSNNKESEAQSNAVLAAFDSVLTIARVASPQPPSVEALRQLKSTKLKDGSCKKSSRIKFYSPLKNLTPEVPMTTKSHLTMKKVKV